MAKKRKSNRPKSAEPKEGSEGSKDANQMLQPPTEPCDQLDVRPPTEPQAQKSDSAQATTTTSESTKKRLGAARGVSALHKVVVKKAQGRKFKIRVNQFGVPTGSNRCTLQSYIGMLARSMIPIDISSWPHVDPALKQKLWLDIQGTFKVAPESESMVLKSAGEKWRQFKTNLTTKHVVPYLGSKKLKKPPKQYEFVGKENWKKFVEQRTPDKWLSLRSLQSQRVRKRKYHHRLSRKGYIGLEEEEIKKGKMKREEKRDRAIFWKKARMSKDETQEVDEETREIFSVIDDLLEKKEKGEFQPSGSDDVLSTALATSEHSGRVRGVGGHVTPTMFFNLPKEKKCRITKAELLARDRKMAEELERTRREMAELKALFNASNQGSPIFSDKSSCQPHEEAAKVKPPTAKELKLDDDCVALYDPPPTEKKGPKSCELAVETLENKVAFGTVFDDEEMNVSVHGVPLKPGHVRVSVDGHIKPDALVPVPIAGEIQKVSEAVGSHLAWPRDLIIFPNMTKKKKVVVQSKPRNEQRNQGLKKLKLNKNVPSEYKFLYNYVLTTMKDNGVSVPIPCDSDVFGVETKIIYILHENLKALLEFDMIGQAAISAYMAHLHTEIQKNRKNDNAVLYYFFDPGLTYNLGDEFKSYVVSRLREGNHNHLYFLPHNHNYHWILVVIWGGDVYLLNPLPHPVHFDELEKALSEALKSYNSETGRGNKPCKIKNLLGSPKQPGGVECGYVVMRYMKDIILEDEEISFTTKWGTKSRTTYKAQDLDEVRMEAIKFIQDKM